MDTKNKSVLCITFFIAILIFFTFISGCSTNMQEKQSINGDDKNNFHDVLTLKNVQDSDNFFQRYPKPNNKFVVITTTLDPGVVVGKIVDVGSYKKEHITSLNGASSPSYSTLWMTFEKEFGNEQLLSQIATLETDTSSLYKAYGKEYFNIGFRNHNDILGGGYNFFNGTGIGLVFEIPTSENPKSITIPYFVEKNNNTEVESVILILQDLGIAVF